MLLQCREELVILVTPEYLVPRERRALEVFLVLMAGLDLKDSLDLRDHRAREDHKETE